MFWVMLTWCCLGPWPGPETGAEGGWAAFWTGQRWGGHRHWPVCSGHPVTSPGSLSHCAASVLINTFCSDFLLPLASADRCDWVVSLLTDVAITRYIVWLCVAPLMAASRLMMITGVTLRWPAPAVTGDSCSANTDLWLAASDQVTQIQGSYWPSLASYGLYTQLVSYWRRLLFIKLPSDWPIVVSAASDWPRVIREHLQY